MSNNAHRDGNFVPTLQGVSSDDGITPTDIWVNPLTGALIIDSTSLYAGLDPRYLKLTADNDPLTGDLNFSGAYGAYFRDGNTWIYSGGVGSLGLVATSQILMTTNAVQIGKNNNEDIALTFNAASNDGSLTWMEDENYFLFGNNVTLGGNSLTADMGIFASGITSGVPGSDTPLVLVSPDAGAANSYISINGSSDNFTFTDTSGGTLTLTSSSISSSTGAFGFTDTLTISVPTATSEALILKTTDDNATKNIFEVQDSSGVLVGAVNPTGVFLSQTANAGFQFGTTANPDFFQLIAQAAGNTSRLINEGVMFYDSVSGHNFRTGTGGTSEGTALTIDNGIVQMVSTATTRIPLTVKAAASQTANLTEWQNSGGTVLASINSSGYLGIGINADSIVAVKATTTFAPASGTVYGLFSNITTNPSAGATSAYGSYSSIKVQNTNTQAITELYGIRGVVDAEDAAVTSAYGIYADVPSVDTGSITNAYGIFINDGVVGAGSTTTAYGLWFQNIDSATTNYAIYTNLGGIRFGDQLSVIGSQDITQSIIKANATQTANLTEWQNSSGTVLAQIEDDGRLYVNISDTVGSLGNFSYSSKLSRTFTGTNFGASANAYISTYNLANIQHSGTGTNPTVRALQNEVTVSVGGGSIKNIVGIYNNPIVNHASSTVTNAYGSWNVIQAFAGTITNAYGQFIGSPNTTGTITNNYGIYVANQSGADTLNYAIFTNAGKVRLGDELTTVGARIKSTETSTTTATISDSVEVHICNGASDYTLTLPAHVAGKEIRIINENAGVVTLSPTSGTIKGSATEMLYEWESLILISTGTNWV